MAEIERTEHGDFGRARAWTLRAVRALHDPAWTADGYVSDRWRPVSPVTGRLDAFQWQTPVAALPSDKAGVIESSAFEEAMLATPHRAIVLEPPRTRSNCPPSRSFPRLQCRPRSRTMRRPRPGPLRWQPPPNRPRRTGPPEPTAAPEPAPPKAAE